MSVWGQFWAVIFSWIRWSWGIVVWFWFFFLTVFWVRSTGSLNLSNLDLLFFIDFIKELLVHGHASLLDFLHKSFFHSFHHVDTPVFNLRRNTIDIYKIRTTWWWLNKNVSERIYILISNNSRDLFLLVVNIGISFATTGSSWISIVVISCGLINSSVFYDLKHLIFQGTFFLHKGALIVWAHVKEWVLWFILCRCGNINYRIRLWVLIFCTDKDVQTFVR
jgi:hypothetical protein